MKAGWAFCKTDYNPLTMEITPLWPPSATPAQIAQINYLLYDVRRLDTAASPADHVHQVMGSIGLTNDDVGDGHYHYVQYYNNSWVQITMGAAPHNHTAQLGGVGNVRFLPDFFCIFVFSANDAIFNGLMADPDWYLIGESTVTFDATNNQWLFGDIDNTAFTPTELATWVTRFRAALGRELPVLITTPRRLVAWFCPQAAPNMYDWWDESKFRPTSISA